ITARRMDRELNCSLTDPVSGDTANASVLLDVQYKPEILHADAHYQEVNDSGLLLMLFVLVQANPPASITWVDQDGRVLANASEFLLLDAKRYPRLANHSLCVHLSSMATNLSVTAGNSLGITTASLLPPGLLDARVELPLLGVAVGSALALSTLLGLGFLAACLARHQAKQAPVRGVWGWCRNPLNQHLCPSSLEHSQPPSTRLSRENRSLPPDLRLGELMQEDRGEAPMRMGPVWAGKTLLCPPSFPTADPRDTGAKGEQHTLPGQENSLVLSNLSFVRFPVAGRIYKVPSTSSDEIWL
ncbi:TMM25 protein, partial [Chauna torquata]|nr:TMM25 protein [Chauna torquata]